MKFRAIPTGHQFYVYGDQAINYDYPKLCLCEKMDEDTAQELGGIRFLIDPAYDCDYIGPMTNPHVIIGSGKMCMCGSQYGISIHCSDVIKALATVRKGVARTELAEPMELIVTVLNQLIEDCPTPETAHDTKV